MKLKFTTKTMFGMAIAALTSACTMAAQPVVSTIPALYKAFTEHPTHCAALLEGRAGDLVKQKVKDLQPDEVATTDLKTLQAEAASRQQRSGLDRSLLRDCSIKQKR